MDINDAWKSTCKVLLGDEIGELDSYKKYLRDGTGLTLSERKSEISGKTVTTANTVPKKAGFISSDEIAEYGKVMAGAKLDINQIKDIDSIVEALEGRMYYSGNIVLGKFDDVRNSDKCTDSAVVYRSQMVYEGSRYVAYSNMVRSYEYGFGLTLSGESKFVIKASGTWKDARCFEVLRVYNSSDCYMAANLDGCTSCMFSFNQRNKSSMIGNLQLSRDRYAAIKEKLLEDMRTSLKSKKMVGITDIVAGADEIASGKTTPRTDARPPGMKEIQKGFDAACTAVLGAKLGPLEEYGDYLGEDSGALVETKSMLSGTPVFVSGIIPASIAVKDRMLALEETVEFGKNHIQEAELEKLAVSTAAEILKRISPTSLDAMLGTNVNLIECAQSGSNTAHAYRGAFVYHSKYTSYTTWPRNSDYVSGCFNTVMSNFCLKCKSSFNITRCFEVSDSHNCIDCLFCHNCEGLDNCMFCFNTKSKRYAIGNVEIGRERYLKVKKMILDEIVAKVRADKRLEYGIYSVGCGNGHK